MPSPSEDLAARIRALRNERGWSARELAERCLGDGARSLTRGTIAKIESGVRASVTFDEAVSLARVLGVSLDSLTTERSDAGEPPTTSASSDDDGPTIVGSSTSNDSAPYFFLAYAHTPEQSWVKKLFRDLCAELLERTTLPLGSQIGFMDDGDPRHQDESLTALATCRVFVPLYSPRYFTRVECGREWHAFAQRILDHKARNSGNIKAIVPALWTPVDVTEMPTVARHLQPDALGQQEYLYEGLYTLIKNNFYAESYTRAVHQLAKQIIIAGETSQLRPCRVRDFGPLRNAFDDTKSTATPTDRKLTIAIAAPTLDWLPVGRSSKYYGPNAKDWIPFHPEARQSLAQYAAAVARYHGYEPDVISFENDFEKLVKVERDGGLAVLMIDPWVTSMTNLAQKLQYLDNLGTEWLATMVLWNFQDQETRAKQGDLAKLLFSAMPRRINEAQLPLMQNIRRISSINEFRIQFPEAVEHLHYQYLNHARVAPETVEPFMSLSESLGGGSDEK